MKKKTEKVVYHQHQDEHGAIFGSSHPIDAEHKNAKTQKYHDSTIAGVTQR